MSKSKEMLKTKHNKYPKLIEVYQRDTEDNQRSAQWPNLKQFGKKKNVILDYRLKNKINIYESIPI